MVKTKELIVCPNIHGSGCAGDFYMAYILMRDKSGTRVEGTEVGINIYKEGVSENEVPSNT